MARARKRRTLTRQGVSEGEIASELAVMQEEESDDDEEISEDDDDDEDGDKSNQFYGIGDDGKMGTPAPPAPPAPPRAATRRHCALPRPLFAQRRTRRLLGTTARALRRPHSSHPPLSRPRRVPLLQGRRRAALLRWV